MVVAHALFRLPHDTAHVVYELLTSHDVDSLCCVSSDARRSPFQTFRDARPSILVLPPLDENRARTLLTRIERRNPGRASHFQCIHVATRWHVDLLVDTELGEQIQRVRVVPLHKGDFLTATKICDELARLPRITQLDLSDTAFVRLPRLVGMTQLRALTLNRAEVRDVSNLGCLPELQSLVMEDTIAADLSCIADLQQLRILKVTRHRQLPMLVHIPALRNHSKLHTLYLESCTIEGAGDLVLMAPSLKHLTLSNVRSRVASSTSEDIQQQELVQQLTQLETINVTGSRFILSGTIAQLSKLPSLRVITHAVGKEFRALESLEHLHEFHLSLSESRGSRFRGGADLLGPDPEDLFAPFQFSQLTTLSISQDTEPVVHMTRDERAVYAEIATRNAAQVLMQLSGLKRLKFIGYIDANTSLPRLSQLEHLELGICKPELTSFDWIRSFHSLRSLKIIISSIECDLSAVGTLTQLEELDLFDDMWQCGETRTHAFLNRLVNVRKLRLAGMHFHDLSIVQEMTSLETLAIESTCTRVPTKNVGALVHLTRLYELNLAKTNIQNVSPLVGLRLLRTLWIPRQADCAPLAECDHPTLLRVFHPDHNCLWSRHQRDGDPLLELGMPPAPTKKRWGPGGRFLM